jgi:hypothetical protein
VETAGSEPDDSEQHLLLILLELKHYQLPLEHQIQSEGGWPAVVQDAGFASNRDEQN